MELFRREALDGQDRLHGDIVFVPQISWRLLAAFFAAALAVAALFLVTAQYHPATSIAGRVAAHDGSLVASFEIPAAAARSLVPGQRLRLSAHGVSRPIDARVGTLSRSGADTAMVQATLDGGATLALRPGMTVRATFASRPRTLAAWLLDALFGRDRE
ncbi:MAG TPA: hypothetical protein VEW25_02035 [Allosphingosinicella sp.]|nr:hypothetical protein [Allosphingosinicella sp.]